MNTERKNATQWPKMILAVYASLGSGDHSGDKTTKNVMDRVVSWLIKGKELSPKLKDALLENIRQRTSFVIEEPVPAIRLTREQIKYAKRTNPEWFGLDLDDDLPEETGVKVGGMVTPFTPADQAIPQPFHTLSTIIQHSFHTLSTTFPHLALELAQDLVRQAAENCGSGTTSCSGRNPKEEIMKEDERNHDGDVIPAHAGLHENQVSVQDSMIQNPAHQGSLVKPDVDECIHEQPDSPPIPEHEGEEMGQSSGARSPARQLSIWVKEKAGKFSVSGNYEIGNESYKMVFKAFDTTLEKLNMEGVDNKAFRDKLNQDVYPYYRNLNPTGDLKDNFQMSAIYGPGDFNAYKDPIASEMAIGLEWDADNQITGLYHIDNDQIVRTDVKKYDRGLYKATLR